MTTGVTYNLQPTRTFFWGYRH